MIITKVDVENKNSPLQKQRAEKQADFIN